MKWDKVDYGELRYAASNRKCGGVLFIRKWGEKIFLKMNIPYFYP